jgi:creatinine amidohydrolase/Fe(II)-dependent formamide hydrolase-like protein
MWAWRIWLLIAVLLAPVAGHAQIVRMGELNAVQIANLDREKTVVLIPGGILEEHGPYLPVYTDGYAGRYYTDSLARAIVARPGWKVVILPEIPLGFGGANNIGAKWDFSGSFTIRLSTLRSVYMDLLGALGAQRFRWVFIVHDHGDPAHNQALDQASDYFHDTFGGAAVHLFGLSEVEACRDTATLLSKEAADEDGFTVHAGAEEQSEMLFVHPEFVSPSYKSAVTVRGSNFEDLYNLAGSDTWPGYFGAPSRASRAIGRQVMKKCSQALATVALRVLDGFDYRKLPRFFDTLDPRDAIGDKAERRHDGEIEAKQKQWLKSKGLE